MQWPYCVRFCLRNRREDEDGIRKIVLDEFDKRGQIIDAVSKKEFTIYFDKYGNAYNSVII